MVRTPDVYFKKLLDGTLFDLSTLDQKYFSNPVFLTEPYVPFLFIPLYLALVQLTRPTPKQLEEQSKKDAEWRNDPSKKGKRKPLTPLRLYGLIHDIMLSVYSGYVFYTGCLAVKGVLARTEGNLAQRFCREMQQQYTDPHYKWIAWTFYVSKYYEVVDTLLLSLSHKNPGTLQVFHHALAPLGMYLVLVGECVTGLMWLLLNGFIHTVMYAYYACCILGWQKYMPIRKSTITTWQMIQFCIGNAAVVMVWYAECDTLGGDFAGYFSLIYTSILLVLFNRFFKASYAKKGAQKPQGVSHKRKAG